MIVTAMKKLVLMAILLICDITSLGGSTDPTAQQLLVISERQASLFHDQAHPLQLDVAFVTQINVPTQGHLTLKWAARDRWWRKIVMGDFEQIEVRNGDRLYTSRNTRFAPMRVGELINMLQFADVSESLEAKKQRRRVENGLELMCLKVDHENSKEKSHEVCINSGSHDIVSQDWQEPPDERRREQFADYFEFAGHRYPRKLQLSVNGISAITATVENLTTTVFDQALLTAPKGAIERRQCPNLKHPVPLKTPDPAYPKSASQNKLMGDTIVAMTVLIDGSVSDIQLVGSAGHSMDEATLQTLKGWKFRPAMCGEEPVVSDIQVIVSFRLD